MKRSTPQVHALICIKMQGKEDLLKLAYKQLDQAAKLLNAAIGGGSGCFVSPKRPFTLSCPSRRTRRTSSSGRARKSLLLGDDGFARRGCGQ
jgi:hypothetical protein